MANQYSGSFEHKIKQKFDCSAREILQKFAEENLTYDEVEKKLGFTHGTIRKGAKKYGISLKSNIEETEECQNSQFFSPQINSHNFLSRKWTLSN